MAGPVLSEPQKKYINVAVCILAAYTAADWAWVSVYHQKPMLDFVEPFMGVLGAGLLAVLAFTWVKHHPLV